MRSTIFFIVKVNIEVNLPSLFSKKCKAHSLAILSKRVIKVLTPAFEKYDLKIVPKNGNTLRLNLGSNPDRDLLTTWVSLGDVNMKQ